MSVYLVDDVFEDIAKRDHTCLVILARNYDYDVSFPSAAQPDG